MISGIRILKRTDKSLVGTRTTLSPFQSFLQSISFNIMWLGLYFFSAWLFSEISIWSAPDDAKLGWVLHGIAADKDKLNERAIFFRFIFMILATVQAVWHIYDDCDKILLPVHKVTTGEKEEVSSIESPRSQIRRRAPEMCVSSASKAGISFGVGITIYIVFLRHVLWDFTFGWTRYVFTLRQFSYPTGLHPFIDMILRILFSTFLLSLLWDFSNAVFSAYIAQEPLKKGQPITADSKDPNGSLIRGLDHRLKSAKSFAFWELWIIASRFQDRRKTIYSDIDRQPSTWTQISTLCLREIQGISDRVAATNDAPSPSKPPEVTPVESDPVPVKQPVVQPLKSDPITAQTPPPKTRSERVGRLVGSFAKQHGFSPSPPRPFQEAQKAIGLVERTLLPAARVQDIHDMPETIRTRTSGLVTGFVKNRFLGWPFRQTFARKAVAVICGAPAARTSIVVDATRSLARLCVESLREDPYGNVAKDIKGIVAAMVTALKDAQGFLVKSKPHWSDLYFTESERTNVEEANEVIDALKGGLQEILGAFAEYASGVGLSQKELTEAKTLVSGKEMKEKRG